jgi:hypothetical protein
MSGHGNARWVTALFCMAIVLVPVAPCAVQSHEAFYGTTEPFVSEA